jgi:hypothetical protein
MTGTIEIVGTGGIIEGNLEGANVNVNLDPVYGNFNGSTSSINAGNPTMFDDIFNGAGSITAWVHPKGLGGGSSGRIFDKSKWVLHLYTESNSVAKLRFFINEGDGVWTTTNNVLPFNAWSHVAVVYDGSSTSNNPVIYINGVSVDVTEDDAPSAAIATEATSDLFIGNRSGADRGFNGYIMDAKIYKAAGLTSDQIPISAAKINQEPTLISTASPKGWYKLTADTTTDSSGNSNTASASNMGSVVYDAFSVDVYDNSTTTDGTFTVTQGKVEGKALSSLDSEESSDTLVKFTEFNIGTKYTLACWVNHESVSGAQTYFGGNSANEYLDLQNNGDTLLLRPKSTVAAVQIDVSDAIGAAIATGRWYHIAVSRTDTAVEFYIDGIKAGATQTLAANEAHAMDAIFAEHDGGTDYIFDGKGRDFRIYDFPLSADQMASLYSNTFVTTPLHWWKLDEGHATAALNNAVGAFEDSGTGTDADGQGVNFVDASCVNGTLDLDGALTIGATGTLSAPRGNLDLATDFDNNGTDPTTSFEHNSGTVRFNGVNSVLNGGADPTGTIFNNLEQAGSGYIDSFEAYRVVSKLTVKAGETWFQNGGTIVSIGEVGTNGELENNGTWHFGGGTTTSKIVGANTNAGGAALIDWNNNVMNNTGVKIIELDNINVDGAFTTAGTADITFQLTGDCEFDAVTVSSGDTLDINGQRAEFSGTLDIDDGGIVESAGSLIYANATGSGYAVDSDGSWTTARGLGTTDLVVTGSSVNLDLPGGNNPFRTIMINSAGTVNKYYEASADGNVIIGAGTYDSNSQGSFPTDFTIATGGTFTAGGTTSTVAGDFTTSGGLIGKSAMVVSGDNDFEGMSVTELQAKGDWGFSGSQGLTIEGWFKFDDLDFGESGSNDAILAGHVRSGDTTGKRYGCGLQIMDDKVMAIAANNDTAHTHYDNCSFPVSDLTAGKWHHLAMTVDDANLSSTPLTKLYLDGKLKAQVTGVTSVYFGYNFVVGGYADNHDGQNWTGRRMDGAIARASCFRQEMTAAQLRSMMFTTYTEMAALSSGVDEARAVGWWQFDEGTGNTVDNKGTAGAPPSSDHSKFDGKLSTSFLDSTCDYNHTGGSPRVVTHNTNAKIVAGLEVSGTGIPAGATIASIDNSGQFTLSADTTATATNGSLMFKTPDGSLATGTAWAASGTFDKGTDSTVNMTNADGKMYLGNLGYSFENLGLAPSGGTTTITKVSHGGLRVYKTLTHNGGTFAQSGNINTEIKGAGTVSAGATIPYICYWGSSTNVPSANFQYFIADTGTVTFAGNCTFNDGGNGYMRTGAYKIVAGAFSHSVRTLTIDGNGTMDLSNSTITMLGTTSSTNFADPNSTLLSGNTTIIGHASNTYWLSPAAAGHEIVGNVSNLLGSAGNDLTIIGSVTNCTGVGFRQWHHTLDTQQLLDADEAGDDDLRLTKPALDNALELMTK